MGMVVKFKAFFKEKLPGHNNFRFIPQYSLENRPVSLEGRQYLPHLTGIGDLDRIVVLVFAFVRTEPLVRSRSARDGVSALNAGV